MKQIILIILSVTLFFNCANDDNTVENTNTITEISGEYTYTYTNCDNSNNPEFNCTHYINFKDEKTVHVLVGDIVFIAEYIIQDETITINFNEFSSNLEYLIIDNYSLKEISTGFIWTKAN